MPVKGKAMENADISLMPRRGETSIPHCDGPYHAMIMALPLPVGLIDYSGHIQFSNAAFQNIQSASHHFTAAGTFSLRERGAARQMKSAIEALKFGPQDSSDIYVKPQNFNNTSPERGAEILWMRLQLIPNDNLIMVSIYAPNITALDGDGLALRLQNLFDLSSAEAATALCLAGGASAASIAQDRGVSLPTVRTQLCAIRTKMGVKTSLEAVVQITKLSLPL